MTLLMLCLQQKLPSRLNRRRRRSLRNWRMRTTRNQKTRRMMKRSRAVRKRMLLQRLLMQLHPLWLLPLRLRMTIFLWVLLNFDPEYAYPRRVIPKHGMFFLKSPHIIMIIADAGITARHRRWEAPCGDGKVAGARWWNEDWRREATECPIFECSSSSEF